MSLSQSEVEELPVPLYLQDQRVDWFEAVELFAERFKGGDRAIVDAVDYVAELEPSVAAVVALAGARGDDDAIGLAGVGQGGAQVFRDGDSDDSQPGHPV